MIINFTELGRSKMARFQATGRNIRIKYVVGELKYYDHVATIGYLDNITIGTLDPHTLQWFGEPITS